MLSASRLFIVPTRAMSLPYPRALSNQHGVQIQERKTQRQGRGNQVGYRHESNIYIGYRYSKGRWRFPPQLQLTPASAVVKLPTKAASLTSKTHTKALIHQQRRAIPVNPPAHTRTHQ
eukprot:1159839-Pelagomonas_calceolata.AAC.13